MSERYDNGAVTEAPEMTLDVLSIHLERPGLDGTTAGKVSYEASDVGNFDQARAAVMRAASAKIGPDVTIMVVDEHWVCPSSRRFHGSLGILVKPLVFQQKPEPSTSVFGTWISRDEALKAWITPTEAEALLASPVRDPRLDYDNIRNDLEQETVRIDRTELALGLEKPTHPIGRGVDYASSLAAARAEVEKDLAARERVPGNVPSGMAQRSIAQGLREAAAAEGARRAKRVREIAKTAVVVLAALALAFGVSAVFMGCASAREDLHAAASAALGVLHAAQENPELVAESKVLLGDLAGKSLSPTDAALVQQALAHVNDGEMGRAAALVAPLVAASAPKAAGP